MSLLYIDGFSHYATSDFGAKGWSKTDNTATTVVQSAVQRFAGASAIRWNGASSGSTSVTFLSRAVTAAASWVIGFAFRMGVAPSSAAAIVSLRDAGTTQVDLRLNPDGTLAVTRAGTALTGGTSALSLSPDTWYYIEWKVTIANSIAASSCKVRVGGVDWLTVAAAQDTQATANASANQLVLGQVFATTTGTTYVVYLTDLYVCDQSGSVNNDFLGDMRVLTLLPGGAGNTTGWTASAGSNYQCVDEAAPNGDTDYVSTATATTKDTYAYPSLSVSPSTIAGVQTVLDVRKDDAGSRTVVPVTRSGGTDYDGSSYSVTDTYAMNCQIRETDPATSAAWTESGVNAAEWGVKLTA